MERITYLLGAGFSAPLGLPVMSNFIEKSKDLYFSDPQRYHHFKRIFKTIDEVSKIKNYYEADLHNIEEVLSILEMSNYAGGTAKKDFKEFICDVIESYTINDSLIEFYPYQNQYDWSARPFSTKTNWELYAYFVANIFSLNLKKLMVNDYGRQLWQYHAIPSYSNINKYSVITLNYDLILENTLKSIFERYKNNAELFFKKEEYDVSWNIPHLAKLHGCVSSRNIIPPTWAKGSENNHDLKQTWNNSYNILKDSNQIRIIGYSLPQTDAYIKYLLKSAIVKNENPKNIDIITLDPSGTVQNGYSDFIKFYKYRFRNANVIDYLETLKKELHLSSGEENILMDKLEIAHEKFMNGE